MREIHGFKCEFYNTDLVRLSKLKAQLTHSDQSHGISSNLTMPPNNSRVKNPDYAAETYVGTIGPMSCHVCKLRGDGLMDPNSNWKLWNADMKVYRDGSGADIDTEIFASRDEKILAQMERKRKAILWFSISEKLREEHLVDMGGRDKSSGDVFKRIHERVAPPGAPYEPLEEFVITKEMRRDLDRRDMQKAAQKKKG